MSLLLTARPRIVAGIYLPSSMQIFWPMFPDGGTQTVSWTGSASQEFGGYQTIGSGNTQTFDNVTFGPGDTVLALIMRSSSSGDLVANHSGDSVGSVSCYGSSNQYNKVVAITDASKSLVSRGTLTLQASSGVVNVSQIAVISSSNRTRANPDMLPWYDDVSPYIFSATTNSAASLTQSTSAEWGSYVRLTTLTGEDTEFDFWSPGGTVYLDTKFAQNSSGGIASASVDGGSSLGTFDCYAGSTTYNNKSSISLGSVALGMHTLRISCSSTSGSAYQTNAQWIRVRRSA